MKDELISVVVPAYNCAPWLPRCLDSLLNQTYQNLEIIVVNDGSQDQTVQIMIEYAQKDKRIRCICKENGGVTSARLRGVQEARGQWIGFVDGDDEIDPQMYEHLIQNAVTYQADISHCGFQEFRPDGSTSALHKSQSPIVQDRKRALQDLLEERIIEPSLCTKLFRKKLFDGLEDKMDFGLRNNEDMLMNYFLFEQAECAVFENVSLYHYLIHPGSASRRKLNQHLIYDPIRVRQIISDRCAPEMKDDARRALARMCLVSYRLLAMETDPEYVEDRKKVRDLIRQQLPYCAVLPKRNALLIRLISAAPWVFDLLYPPFERLLRR